LLHPLWAWTTGNVAMWRLIVGAQTTRAASAAIDKSPAMIRFMVFSLFVVFKTQRCWEAACEISHPLPLSIRRKTKGNGLTGERAFFCLEILLKELKIAPYYLWNLGKGALDGSWHQLRG